MNDINLGAGPRPFSGSRASLLSVSLARESERPAGNVGLQILRLWAQCFSLRPGTFLAQALESRNSAHRVRGNAYDGQLLWGTSLALLLFSFRLRLEPLGLTVQERFNLIAPICFLARIWNGLPTLGDMTAALIQGPGELPEVCTKRKEEPTVYRRPRTETLDLG